MAHYVVFDIINKSTNDIDRRYLLNISVEDSYNHCSIETDKHNAISMIKKDYGGCIPSTYRIDIHTDDFRIIQKYGIENYKFIDYYNHDNERVRLPYYPKLDSYTGNHSGRKSVWIGGKFNRF